MPIWRYKCLNPSCNRIVEVQQTGGYMCKACGTKMIAISEERQVPPIEAYEKKVMVTVYPDGTMYYGGLLIGKLDPDSLRYVLGK